MITGCGNSPCLSARRCDTVAASRPLILFGAGDIAELAHFYFSREAGRQVAGFCVDGAYLREDSFLGLPVVAFEEVAARFAPADHDMFIALAYARMNDLRAEKLAAAEAAGYGLTSYISSRATVLNDGRIGPNAFVQEDVTIQPFVTIGRNVTLWAGATISHHSTIGDNVFVAPNAVVSGGVKVGDNCFLGVNSTVRNHVTLGARCVIGAGAVLRHDAAAGGVYRAPGAERLPQGSDALTGL